MFKRKKGTKEQTTIYKSLHRKLKIDQHEHHEKLGGELSCSVNVGTSYSCYKLCDMSCMVIYDPEYSVKFNQGMVVTSAQQLVTLGSVTSMLAATLFL